MTTKIYLLYSFALFSLFFANDTFAKNVIKVEAIEEYVLGDNDSKSDAKKIALEYAKRRALEKVGTLIESKTVVENGTVTTDEIVAYSSSILKTRILSEKLKLLGNKTVVFQIKIVAEVDKDILYSRIDEAKRNKDKEKAIRTLEKRNRELLNQLRDLNKQLNMLSKRSAAPLLDERTKLLARIEKNHDRIRKVFQEGSLISRVKNLESELEYAKKDVLDSVFANVRNNMSINIGEPEIVLLDKGTCKLCIDIAWDISPHVIKSTLSKYFSTTRKTSHYIYLQKRDNKVNYSDQLFSYIRGKPIRIAMMWGTCYGIIDITEGHSKKATNWRLYCKGKETLCCQESADRVGDFENVDAQLTFNTFGPDTLGPIITWKDIYGRQDLGKRSIGSVSLGYSSRGAGTRYSVRGQYSMIQGEYHGAWASFEDWMINWNYDRVYQYSTKGADKRGSYVRNGDKWIKQ